MRETGKEFTSLKMYRVSLDLYQRDLAKLANVAQTSVSNIESGTNTNWSFHIVLRICAALAEKKEMDYKDVVMNVLGAMIENLPDDSAWLDK